MHAIILKKIPTKEYDELIICYTQEQGKASYVAKSLRKRTSKQAAHLDILTMVDFNLVQKNSTPIITSAVSIESFPYLKRDIQALAVANFVLEVFDKFVFEGDADETLWNFLYGQLTRYDRIARQESDRTGGYETPTDWRAILKDTYDETLKVLGFEGGIDLEAIVGQRFNSLLFARKVLQ